jgi:hypothetical protein
MICDICRERDDTPMLSIYTSMRLKFGGYERNCIIVHRSCWDKALAKLDKKIAKQKENKH